MGGVGEAISHRRFAKSGKKRLILGRSSSLHLPRLRRLFLGFCETLDCDRFWDEFYLNYITSGTLDKGTSIRYDGDSSVRLPRRTYFFRKITKRSGVYFS